MNKYALTVIIAAVALAAGLIGYSQGKMYSRGMAKTADSYGKQLALREDMRKLWTDHVVWTREYIVAALNGAPEADAAAKRLLSNQEDIGKAVAAYYGKDAGDKLTALLKEHIMIAVAITGDAKSGDSKKLDDDSAAWKKNADAIADFLSAANPNWPDAEMRAMMAKHLQTTTDELMAHLGKKYETETAAFDAVYAHILNMADALSDGIIKQFNKDF